jgi:hypothetical protein
MWRRSLNENFFMFETSKTGHLFEEPLLRFYLSKSQVDITDSLTLTEHETGIVRKIQCLMSPLINIPTLDICVVMGKTIQNQSTSRLTYHGALLGIHERGPEYVWFFYHVLSNSSLHFQ